MDIQVNYTFGGREEMEFLATVRIIFLGTWRALSHLHSSSELKVEQDFEKVFDQVIKGRAM